MQITLFLINDSIGKDCLYGYKDVVCPTYLTKSIEVIEIE